MMSWQEFTVGCSAAARRRAPVEGTADQSGLAVPPVVFRAINASAACLIFAVSTLFPTAVSAAEDCSALEGETIRWIVPYSAGGGYDTYSRLIEPVLERHLGAEIAVVNMPGAGGMVGVKSIRAQKPDGKTLGFINASGLLVAQLSDQDGVPSVTEDFSVLARVTRDQNVWLVNAESDIRVNEAGAFVGGSEPLLFGVTGVGSGDWFTITIAKALLKLNADFLAGYDGSKEAVLGLVRGEFDIMDVSWGSAIAPIENGELKPVLQVTGAPISDHPSLEGVPVVGGPDGAARRRAVAMGEDPEVTVGLMDALVEILQAGRIVVAPAGLPEQFRACLEDRVHLALNDPEFIAAAEKARRPLDTGRGQDAAQRLSAAEALLPDLRALIEGSE
ncbi:tripartite tricarboxylate transporter substrate-binding protein [Tropicimonas aquimaris]|uniref:Tripartite tricarboxylate transporter substrate-binding protein n=1 Tax=Tropicimonas aquimaris TaxID=914152 RepID=A0ABW3INW2_9RHOB